MPGHHVELFGYLPALNGNRVSLLAERGGPAHQRREPLFHSVHRLDRAIDEHRHGHHRAGNHDERQRNDRGDHYQPEEWFVWIHLKRGASCLVS